MKVLLLGLGGFVGGALVGALIVQRADGDERWPRAVSGALLAEALILTGLAVGWTVTSATTHVLIVLSALATSASIRHYSPRSGLSISGAPRSAPWHSTRTVRLRWRSRSR